jgi:organic radical activating enzyme
MELIRVKSSWKRTDLRIEFVLGNLCNWKCWYCFPGSNEGTHRFPDFDLTVQNLLHLIRHYKQNGKKRFFLHIIGGEPTLWPKLGEFAEIFSKEGCVISISTNGSRTLRWWREYGKYFSKVILSCHHEQMDLKHNIEVADILYESNCIVDASVLMDPTAWDKCIGIVQGLRNSKHRWPIVANEVFHETLNYNPAQKKYLNGFIKRIPNLWYYFKNNKHPSDNTTAIFSNGNRKFVKPNWIILQKLNNFKDWVCNLGVDSLAISKTGELTGSCNETLYNIDTRYNLYQLDFVEKFNPEIKPVVCTKESCWCQPEANLRKYKVIPLVPV